MKPKQYQIKTVQDMIDCTNEKNLDNFLTDLKAMLIVAHTFRNMAKLIGKTKKVQKIKSEGFTWTDDNKHDVSTTINVK